MKILLFVVTHKKIENIFSEPYKLISVGTNKDNIISSFRDDTGDNIADKNPYYCELTAQYWVWKNISKEYAYIGLCHYRRFFSKNIYMRGKRNYIDSSDIENNLSKYDVILPEPWHWNTSVGEMYYVYGHGKKTDIDKLTNIIKHQYPDYYDAFKEVLSRKYCSYCNMFVMSSENYDKYCCWLFDLLFQLENVVDISTYNKEEKRIYGYLSEILLNVWILKNNLNVKYYPMDAIEKSNFSQIKKHLISKIKGYKN